MPLGKIKQKVMLQRGFGTGAACDSTQPVGGLPIMRG
jgi:hypothetical protein